MHWPPCWPQGEGRGAVGRSVWFWCSSSLCCREEQHCRCRCCCRWWCEWTEVIRRGAWYVLHLSPTKPKGWTESRRKACVRACVCVRLETLIESRTSCAQCDEGALNLVRGAWQLCRQVLDGQEEGEPNWFDCDAVEKWPGMHLVCDTLGRMTLMHSWRIVWSSSCCWCWGILWP